MKKQTGGVLLKNINKEKWNKQKLMEKKKFVLIYGVLQWGMITFIISSKLNVFFDSSLINHNSTNMFFRIIIGAIIFGLVGILFGSALWNSRIRKFDNK